MSKSKVSKPSTPRGVAVEFAARVRKAREARQLTKSVVAEYTGITWQTVHRWETKAEAVGMSIATLRVLAKLYKVTPADLIGKL